MNTHEAIKTVLLSSGGVSFAYKVKPNQWIGEIKIYLVDEKVGIYGGDVIYDKTTDIDAGIEFLLKKIFRKENLALAYRGIEKHKLTDQYLDDLSSDQLRRLVKKYNDKYFAQDYPEFAENT